MRLCQVSICQCHLLARMATEIEMVKLFKIESTGVANKIRALIDAAGDAIEGPFDGEEGITLLADLDGGATGSMTFGHDPRSDPAGDYGACCR